MRSRPMSNPLLWGIYDIFKKIWYCVLCLFFCLCLKPEKLYAQEKAGFGEGKVTIGWYNFPATTPELNDTTGRLFTRMTYCIKNQKIRRQSNTTEETTGFSVDSLAAVTMSVAIKEPNYLIDFEKKIVYTLEDAPLRKKGAIDSLSNYTDDFFYRKTTDSKEIALIDTSDRRSKKMMGMICYNGKYKTKTDSTWIRFVYTKRNFSFKSPISRMVPSFQYPIISIRFPISDTKDSKKIIGDALFCIMNYSEEKQDDSLFTLNQ